MKLADKIREMKKASPDLNNKEIAKNLNTSQSYVYQVVTGYKKPKHSKPVVPSEGQTVLRNELKRLNAKLEQWQNLCDLENKRNDALLAKIKEMREQLAGRDYVISYLESRLGIEVSDGASV